jgi:hypothetical protein
MGQGDIYHPGPREDLGTGWYDQPRHPAGPGPGRFGFCEPGTLGACGPFFGAVPITIGEPIGKVPYHAKYFGLTRLAWINITSPWRSATVLPLGIQAQGRLTGGLQGNVSVSFPVSLHVPDRQRLRGRADKTDMTDKEIRIFPVGCSAVHATLSLYIYIFRGEYKTLVSPVSLLSVPTNPPCISGLRLTENLTGA